MKTAFLIPILIGAAAAVSPASAQPPAPAPSPGEIVATAPASDWTDIAADDLLVMTLAPDAKARARIVVIQLVPAPFGQGWVDNIRTIARAHWWDGTSVYRVQDNYVAQWGEPEDDSPKAKALPQGLKSVPESDYVAKAPPLPRGVAKGDAYAPFTANVAGWSIASDGRSAWPLHCYGAVGVARGMSPDTGTGSELYTVIGHAPRHLDRNIAVVGRIIEGMEHLSSLPRGPAPLGMYETAGERTPILSIRLASELPPAQQPHFQFLSSEADSFRRYADARANRRDPFFLVPAGGADICNMPVPIRRKP